MKFVLCQSYACPKSGKIYIKKSLYEFQSNLHYAINQNKIKNNKASIWAHYILKAAEKHLSFSLIF